MIYPLIRHTDVHTSALGEPTAQMPAGVRTYEPTKAVVMRVYPPGHPQNRLGQTLVDLQPLADLPMLFKVPVCLSYAHAETEPVDETGPYQTTRRQAYAAKPRNRVEGSSYDLRQGTYVWVQFLGGSLHDPVVVATMKPNRQDGDFPAVRQRVDRINAEGALAPRKVVPLDADVAEYPRHRDAYNGVSVEIDNEGSYHIDTSTDRQPVFPGDGDIPASPEPKGNYGVSTRGARVGHQVFTTGKDPDTDDASAGRHVRQSLAATDGTIRDETRSTRGDIIHLAKEGLGRLWNAAKGSAGWHYLEDRVRSYLDLNGQGTATLHGKSKAVLDAPSVHLGSQSAGDNVVLWPQLNDLLQQIWLKIDTHVHVGVQTGAGQTGIPLPAPLPFAAQWATGAPDCRSDVVFAEKSSGSSPNPREDPDG